MISLIPPRRLTWTSAGGALSAVNAGFQSVVNDRVQSGRPRAQIAELQYRIELRPASGCAAGCDLAPLWMVIERVFSDAGDRPLCVFNHV